VKKGKRTVKKEATRSTTKRSDGRGRAFRRSAVLAGVFLCFAFVVQGIFGANGLLTLRQKRHEYNSMIRKIQQLKKENQELQEQIQGLRSDPETIGRFAREELHMVRPGEVIYVLPQKNRPAKESAALSPGSPKP
jgi:cell division protein FtsB